MTPLKRGMKGQGGDDELQVNRLPRAGVANEAGQWAYLLDMFTAFCSGQNTVVETEPLPSTDPTFTINM